MLATTTIVVLLCASVVCVSADWGDWTTDDFAMFDLVEELQHANFYEMLEVTQDASVGDIKRAYRRLSLLYHPDKNKAEDAAVKFRQLAAVYEVLKTEETRQKYNNVLEFGLPDWRQPIFYYRSLRKMPLWETLLILIVIISIAQYLMMWGAYWERKFTIQSFLESKLRKQEKKLKRKHNVDVDELIDEQVHEQLERPNWRSLFPFWCLRITYMAIVSTPSAIQFLYETATKPKEVPVDENAAEEVGPVRERVRVEHVEYDMAEAARPVNTWIGVEATTDADHGSGRSTERNTGPWTIDELNYLVRLSTAKFPVGTPNRWEKMADALNRKQQDVTQMIGKLKHVDPNEYHQLCPSSGSSDVHHHTNAVNPLHSDHTIATPRINIATAAATEWTQTEQKQLEAAMQQFPKTVDDRWEKIADCIAGRTKEECLARYKHLVSLVRQRKTTKS